ncbi:formylmethanofuran dehydrogenase subunit C [Blastopirellula marina]|uniref:Formylmethanofuran dehydrogenase n=1 Tax=Blastopirellula marina DSM 3645 TaxID=314230 RepID=A4A271_9BACT|nr:formylmethanofuran dehydrogenase subunit C [Blastopirellula marina]EAQ77104.1 Formylmethanofuran dehydrogenase [Blastopirellula marina DSM 3645]
MPLTLTLVQDIAPDIGLREITPQRLASLTPAQIAKISLCGGGQGSELGDLFQLQGDAADQQLRWIGDFSQCDYLGAGMRSGEVVVEGDVGDHAGAAMSGGKLTITGSAGDYVGSPNPGEKRGLQGGSILIHGDAGRELGTRMRRGLIAVSGDVGALCGYRMLAGTIVVSGKLGKQAGLRMKRGTIVTLSDVDDLPATFHADCEFLPPMAPLLWRELERLGFPIERAQWERRFRLYSGDAAEMSRGEILSPVS